MTTEELEAWLAGETEIYIRKDHVIRELIAARRVVEAAREASAALKYSENEIANLENVLSDYRQNWQEAQSAHQQLDASLSAYEEAKG